MYYDSFSFTIVNYKITTVNVNTIKNVRTTQNDHTSSARQPGLRLFRFVLLTNLIIAGFRLYDAVTAVTACNIVAPVVIIVAVVAFGLK
jgi:hypothetical protein